MRALVTGGAGFIGSHIVDRLRARGDEVFVVDDLSTGSEANLPAGIALTHLDLAAPGAAEVVAGLRPGAVVHCAAQPSVSASVVDPVGDAMVNIIGGINVITGAIAAGAERFIYLNTGGALYGEPVRIPSKEDEAVKPLSPYGMSKSAVEGYLAVLAPRSTWWSSLRLANVYGPRQGAGGEAGVVGIFIQRMIRGLPIEIHGDGEQTRDFVYVEDVAEAVELALFEHEHAILNIGTGTPTSINNLFDGLSRTMEYRNHAVRIRNRPGDVRESALDASRALEVLGWAPRTTLAEGLKRTIAWHRAHEAVRA
jgi:UDP-glucose 4-epimerase